MLICLRRKSKYVWVVMFAINETWQCELLHSDVPTWVHWPCVCLCVFRCTVMPTQHDVVWHECTCETVHRSHHVAIASPIAKKTCVFSHNINTGTMSIGGSAHERPTLAPMGRGDIVLVTGGSGLVGHGIRSALDDELRARKLADVEKREYIDALGVQWVFASSTDADLTQTTATQALFDRVRPTHVVHLAAMVGGLFRNQRQNVEMFRVNSAINDNVLACAHEHRVTKVVSCLSTCIFPDRTTYPLDETMVHDGPPHDSNLGYAVAKRNLDVLSRLYRRQYGDRFVTVVPTNVFGEHDNFHLDDAHVIPGLIHKFHRAKAHGTPMELMGTGAPLRQFLYARDLGRMFLWALRNYDEESPLIFSVPELAEVTIKDVAQSIARHLDYDGAIMWTGDERQNGQHKKTASPDKFLALYRESQGKEFEYTPFDQALRATCQWFVEHYDTAARV